jgi:hypothetical protein
MADMQKKMFRTLYRKIRATAFLLSLAPMQGTIKEEFFIPSHDTVCIQTNKIYLAWKETPCSDNQEGCTLREEKIFHVIPPLT